jgi:hypothetical protein
MQINLRKFRQQGRTLACAAHCAPGSRQQGRTRCLCCALRSWLQTTGQNTLLVQRTALLAPDNRAEHVACAAHCSPGSHLFRNPHDTAEIWFSEINMLIRTVQPRCNVSQFIYLCKMLYMFQTVFCVHHQELKTAHTSSGIYQINTATCW